MTQERQDKERTDNKYQVGNFIYINEDNHVTIMDINSLVVHKVSKELNIGRLLTLALEQKNEQFLRWYAAILWQFSNCIMDSQFLQDFTSVWLDCVNRNKEFYGIKEDITKEEDDKILNEERELRETLEMTEEELKGEEGPKTQDSTLKYE